MRTREEIDLAFQILTRDLESGTYWQNRLNLRRRIRPPYDRFLYKYRSVDPKSDKSIDQLRDIVVRSRFWLSAPVDFNYPCDMGAAMIAVGSRQQMKQRTKMLVARHFKGSRTELRQKARKMGRLSREDVVTRGQQSLARARQETGIASLTLDPRNIQMWSYYAAKHEGRCLQFEVARDPARMIQAVDVDYDDNYPTINFVEETLEQTAPLMLRKHSGWIAERERRIVIPSGARTYLAFRPDALTGSFLVVGCRPASAMSSNSYWRNDRQLAWPRRDCTRRISIRRNTRST